MTISRSFRSNSARCSSSCGGINDDDDEDDDDMLGYNACVLCECCE